MEIVKYDTSAAADLAEIAKKTLTDASDYIIDSDTLCELAGADLKKIKMLQKEVEEKRTSITGPINQALKSVNDLFRAPKEYLEKAEVTLKKSIVAYTSEQERIAAEARRKAEAEARAERERLAKQERELLEAARLAEIKSREAAAAGNNSAAAKAMQDARSAQVMAEHAASESAAVTTTAPSIAPPAKVEGISHRITYIAEVVNLLDLVKAVASGSAPVECLQADTKYLGLQARAIKKAGVIFPGVISKEEKSLSVRS